MKFYLLLVTIVTNILHAQTDSFLLIKAEGLFDGESMHNNWSVLVKNNKIEAVGDNIKAPLNTQTIVLKNATLLPGLIEGHSHLFLHPYNETAWDDQVLKESRAERTARAVNHARATLLAGFTSVRDLGTEGAAYDDAGLKRAIEKKIIPGPRMIIATKAIVAKGSYGPKPASADIELHQGAAEVSGIEEMMREVRDQVAHGADVIKLYADYRWGLNGDAAPTFTVDEMKAAVAIAAAGGRQVVAHASSAAGMRNAVLAGVSTIEHGDQGTAEVFKLMKERNVALCPTLAAGDATSQYRGWQKGLQPEPPNITAKRKTFALALQNNVTICMGGDVGVFSHGDNAREMEMMVDYGMKPVDVLRSATSVNATVFGYGKTIGRLKAGLLADIIAVEGNPADNISDIRRVLFVMKNGMIYKTPLVEGR